MSVDIKISNANLLPWSNMEDWESGASAAPTEHTLAGASAAVAREATIIKQGTYSAKVTRAGANATLYYDLPSFQSYQGRTVTFGCWVYATAADRGRLSVSDGVGSTESTYHTGGSGWERLSVIRKVDDAATRVRVEMQVNTGDTSVYFDGGLLVEGENDIYVFTDNVDIGDWRPTNTYRSQKFTISRKRGAVMPNLVIDDRSVRIKGMVVKTTAALARTTWDSLMENLSHQYINPVNEEIEKKDLYLFDDRFLRGLITKITPVFKAALTVIDFDIDFSAPDPLYYSAQLYRSSTTIDSSPKSITVTPSGNAPSDPVIKVTAGSADITALTVQNLTTGHSWSYSGTIAAGDALILDVEKLTLENDGVNAFANFSGEPQMILIPGDNLFVVTITGGSTNSTIKIDYFNRWA